MNSGLPHGRCVSSIPAVDAESFMPPPSEDDIRDLYNSSMSQRGKSGDKYFVNTRTDFRFQLALGENVPWIEYNGFDDLRVKRHTGTLPPGQRFIDIADAPPDQFPSEKGVKTEYLLRSLGFYGD